MTVYQRKGIWRYRFQVNGERHFASLPHCKNKTEARAAEDEARTRARRGELQTLAERTTFAAFVQAEFEPWSESNHSPRWHREVGYLLVVFKAFFGSRTFAEISPLLIEKFKSERRKTPTKHDKPRTAATLNRELAVLSSIFALAWKAGFIKENPCSKVSLLMEDNQRERVLEPDEEERLFAVLHERHGIVDNHLLPLVTLAIHTGLRKSELLQLRRSEVDLAAGEIRRATSKNKRRRRIKLNATARATLATVLASGEGEWVFPNPDTGKPFTDVKKGWAAVCKAAGITGLHWHDLRHTFASRLVEAGAHQVEVRDLLGHTSTRTTDRYTHASEERKSAVVESIVERRKAS